MKLKSLFALSIAGALAAGVMATEPVAKKPARTAAPVEQKQIQGKPVMTMFDYLDFDEDRDPVTSCLWEK